MELWDMERQNKIRLTLSFALAGIIVMVSIAGLLVPGIYARETTNWYLQAITQDGIDLLIIAPSLIISAYLGQRSRIAELLWGGVTLYCVYTYAIYGFALHFNMLFPFYCFALGISVFAALHFLIRLAGHPMIQNVHREGPSKYAGYFLITTAVLFELLWLSMIVPSILENTTPDDLKELGLLTNPVHVLDLSVCLPGLFIIGILVVKGRPLGLSLAPAALTFCVLMDVTIGTIAIVMMMNGQETAFFLPLVMLGLSIISASLLIWFMNNAAIDQPDTSRRIKVT
jgi:hypothetical protein